MRGHKNKLTIDELASISSAIDRAAQRPEISAYVEIKATIMVSCPTGKPEENGNGCSLFINPKTETQLGEVGISLRKPIEKQLLAEKTGDMKRQLTELDPNTTEEHLHVCNPLYKLAGGKRDGTHYYCAPEGGDGKKFWQCYLSVSEGIK